MSILGKGNQTNSFTDIEVPVMEGYDVETAGDAYAHQEFVQDMVSVYEAMHTIDIAEIEVRKNNGGVALESCTEGIEEFEAVTESAFSSVGQRLKAALEKLWAKIKGFFKSIRKYFDYLFMNGKDFAKKYQTEIVKSVARADSEFKVEMYEYDNAKIDGVSSVNPYETAEKVIAAHGAAIAGYDSETMNEKIYNTYRKQLADGKGEKEDFAQEVHAYFRKGATDASDKKEIKASDVQGFIKVLMDDKASKELTKMENAMNKAFAKQIKEVNKLIGEQAKGEQTESIKTTTKVVTAFEGCQAIANTFIRMWQGAIKERAGAYKSACMKVMSYRPKNK